MKTALCTFLIVTIFCINAKAQTPDTSWQRLTPLLGNWKAGGGGDPGQATDGSFTFSYDLDKKVVSMRGKSAYPAANGRPAFVHQQLIIIYTDVPNGPLKAIYFDTEGHTINYNLNFTGNVVQFVSQAREHMPSFRLTYTFSDKNKLDVNFEIASPQDPANFKSYVRGSAERVE